ncbi:hypothetical protein JOE33_003681 [Pseudomonas sp. PvP027]|uniref:YfjI family protein n=1 Tax=Pseudomonas sp. PvP027 TaxID=2806587 RepID=UPI001AEB9D19|nr:YfjI family protein [Pseudomonas sp. PvP027]MBP1146758.1 hypothetical protein [Pseudomonas sp. PvP027]
MNGFLNMSAVNDAFPSLIGLPLINAAVDEVRDNVKAPIPLIFSAALTAMSVGLQGLFDVRKPIGGSVPCSLMILTIANSGERKSTVENIFLSGVRRFQSRMAEQYDEELLAWKMQLKIWEVKSKAIQGIIAKRAAKGVDTVSEEARMNEHFMLAPKKPRRFKMLYEDATSQALFRGMYQDLPSAGLISGEGLGVLNGPALNDLPKQNSLWSGDAIVVDRATVESFQLDDARLTVSVMVQESGFNSYMRARGEASRGSGLWARFLVCKPTSTQGSRQVESTTLSTERSERFSDRLVEFVERNVDLLNKVKPQRVVIEFSPEAAQRWIDLSNEIENQISPVGRLKSASDHASKLADNIARLAALLHCFERFEGGISLSTLNVAICLGNWYSREFLKLFDEAGEKEIDVDELADWLGKQCAYGSLVLRKNTVRQYGPSRLRNKKRLDDALELLQIRGAIQMFPGQGGVLINTRPFGSLGVLGYAKQGRRSGLGF